MKKSKTFMGYNSFLKSIVFGTTIGIVTLMILLFVLASILLTGKVSEGLTRVLIIACIIISGCVSGTCGAKKRGRGVVTTGACCGSGVLAVVILARLFLKGSTCESINLTKILIALVAGGVFGGVISTKKFRKNSQLRKR